MDLRLQSRRFEVGGKEYEILVNMNVLADLQEAHGGSLAEALDAGRGELHIALEVLAAMLNEAADAAGAKERFTARSLGRILPTARAGEIQTIVAELLHAALAPDDGAQASEDGADSKN